MPASALSGDRRTERTRAAIAATAERLFAERGVAAVSARQISEAAGQGNNTAVGYHFGTKAGLLHAILDDHRIRTDRVRQRMIDRLGDSADIRDWIACLTEPGAIHLAELPQPTWFARLNAQLFADPGTRALLGQDPMDSPSLHLALGKLDELSPDLPGEVRADRHEMIRQLIVHFYAHREQRLADGASTPHATWQEAAESLTAALTGLWTAPAPRAD